MSIREFADRYEMISCYRCKVEQSTDCFTKGPSKSGRSLYSSYCKTCRTAYTKLNDSKYKATRDKWKDGKRHDPKAKVKQLLRACDRGALDFDWVWSKLEASGFKCEITGAEFTWGSREPTSLSIDQIDPSGGYTPDNVRFVCWWVNAAMGTWGLDKLKELITNWKEV